MQVTINQLSSGLIAQSHKTHVVSFTFAELPESLRERALALLSPNTIADHMGEDVDPGSADRQHLEIEYVDNDRTRRVHVDEATCSPELLDLLDELSLIRTGPTDF